MRLRLFGCLHKICVLLFFLYVPLTVGINTSFGQELKIDELFLELDRKHRIPEEWSILPFDLEDPYNRVKNGPPLTNIITKTNVEWISQWIADPKRMVPNAKMPDLELNFEEIKAIIAYLGSIADRELPEVEWKPFLLKPEDEMTDDEYAEMDEIFMQGKGVWSRARCTICHPVKGEGGNVGVGPDLGKIATKINRTWLYDWLSNTKKHFPDTMMPQYRFTDSDVRGLVEYIMRDYQFKPEEEFEEEESKEGEGEPEPKIQVLTEAEFQGIKNDTALVEKGKSIVERARCVVCHDVKGIPELLPVVQKDRDGLQGFEKVLYEIRCLTCHQIQGNGGTYAPNLTIVGSRIKMKWEENFLQQPDIIRPLSQQMPKFNLTEEDAKAAVSFMEEHLLSKEPFDDIFNGQLPSPEVIQAGEKVFYEKGCNACHADGMKGGGVVGPNLGEVGDRLQPGYIYYHLQHPQNDQINPRSVEPEFKLTDEELKVLTGFLIDHRKKEGK